MASELSSYIDNELKKMEEQPENQRLLSALRVKTSPDKKAKAGLAAAERAPEPRRCCGMAPRTWLAVIGGAALAAVVLALVAGARVPPGQLHQQLAGLKARMPPMPTLGNRKMAPGGPDAVLPMDAAAKVSGAPGDPLGDSMDAADRARHAGTQTSEVLPQHLAAAAHEEPPAPPGHKKHVGPGSGHKHKHKSYDDAERRKREREHHQAAAGAADSSPDLNPSPAGKHGAPAGAKDATLAAARAVQAGAITQTDAAFAAEAVDAAAGAPHVAYGPQHIMTSLAGVDAAAAAAAAALAPSQAAPARSEALAAEPAPAPSLAPAPASGSLAPASGSGSGPGAAAPIPAGLAAAMAAENSELMSEPAAAAAGGAGQAVARTEAGKQAVKEDSFGWWRG